MALPANATLPPKRGVSTASSLNDMVTKASRMLGRRVSIRDRICCYQWTWFTMTMATGGVANVMYSSKSTYWPRHLHLRQPLTA
jgi:hypothetical protein